MLLLFLLVRLLLATTLLFTTLPPSHQPPKQEQDQKRQPDHEKHHRKHGPECKRHGEPHHPQRQRDDQEPYQRQQQPEQEDARRDPQGPHHLLGVVRHELRVEPRRLQVVHRAGVRPAETCPRPGRRLGRQVGDLRPEAPDLGLHLVGPVGLDVGTDLVEDGVDPGPQVGVVVRLGGLHRDRAGPGRVLVGGLPALHHLLGHGVLDDLPGPGLHHPGLHPGLRVGPVEGLVDGAHHQGQHRADLVHLLQLGLGLPHLPLQPAHVLLQLGLLVLLQGVLHHQVVVVRLLLFEHVLQRGQARHLVLELAQDLLQVPALLLLPLQLGVAPLKLGLALPRRHLRLLPRLARLLLRPLHGPLRLPRPRLRRLSLRPQGLHLRLVLRELSLRLAQLGLSGCGSGCICSFSLVSLLQLSLLTFHEGKLLS
mmetsp:Transcript_7276/g.10927  ORF Transcript_7276/g.10927 Transcript_7276/m.10927 type:complete len:423 (-) Transcript_7276:541-1809(-)